MEAVLLDRLIKTDFGQFDLVWGDDYGFDGDFERFFAGQSNGLVGAASGQGFIPAPCQAFGRFTCADCPARGRFTVDSDYEDIVEVSITVPIGKLPTWSTWAGEESGPLSLPPGSYGVRTSARGRDAGVDGEFADAAVDFYLLEVWPAPVQPDSIIRSTSADAEYWHREVGSRR